jgi:hypothetical protein
MPILSSEGGVQVLPQLLIRREMPQNSSRCKYSSLDKGEKNPSLHFFEPKLEYIDSLQVRLSLLKAQLQLQAPEEDGWTYGGSSCQCIDDEHASYGICHARDARYG